MTQNWKDEITSENLKMLEGETTQYVLRENGEDILTGNWFACVCEIASRKGSDWSPGDSWEPFEMDRVGGYDRYDPKELVGTILARESKVQDLRNRVKSIAYNEAQYDLFDASKPEFSDLANYWDVIFRALCYAQGELAAVEARNLDDRLEPDNPSLTVVNLVANHLAFTVQRVAYPLVSGELLWESRTMWVSRVIQGLLGDASVVYWSQPEMVALHEALDERADLARFVGAVNAGIGA